MLEKKSAYVITSLYQTSEGINSAMVTIIGNGYCNPSSNPTGDCFISYSASTVWKSMNPTILPQDMGKF